MNGVLIPFGVFFPTSSSSLPFALWSPGEFLVIKNVFQVHSDGLYKFKLKMNNFISHVREKIFGCKFRDQKERIKKPNLFFAPKSHSQQDSLFLLELSS